MDHHHDLASHLITALATNMSEIDRQFIEERARVGRIAARLITRQPRAHWPRLADQLGRDLDLVPESVTSLLREAAPTPTALQPSRPTERHGPHHQPHDRPPSHLSDADSPPVLSVITPSRLAGNHVGSRHTPAAFGRLTSHQTCKHVTALVTAPVTSRRHDGGEHDRAVCDRDTDLPVTEMV